MMADKLLNYCIGKVVYSRYNKNAPPLLFIVTLLTFKGCDPFDQAPYRKRYFHITGSCSHSFAAGKALGSFLKINSP